MCLSELSNAFQWRKLYFSGEIKFEQVCLINLIGSSKFLFNELKKHDWALEAGSSQV